MTSPLKNNPTSPPPTLNAPPLLNGYGNQTSTVHHPPTANRKSAVLCSPPAVKMVNGEVNSTPASQPTVKSKNAEESRSYQEKLVNGISHEFTLKPKSTTLKREHLDTEEEEDVKPPVKRQACEVEEKDLEARLMEWATFNTHEICYNKRLDYYYVKKRPRHMPRYRHHQLLKSGSVSSTAAKNRRVVKPEGGLSGFLKRIATAAIARNQGQTTTSGTVNSTMPSRLRLTDSSSIQRPNIPTGMEMLGSGCGGQPTQVPSPPPPMFVCEWNNCNRQFPVASQVRLIFHDN